MKLSLVLLLGASTTASALVLTPASQLQSGLPSSKFRADLIFEAPLLPVDPTLASIIHFMNVVARSDYDKILRPSTYTSPQYPQVKITTRSPSTARFLLWGAYSAVVDMIKYSRFNNVIINLVYDKARVGQISILVDTAMGLPSSMLNDTSSVVIKGGGLVLDDVGNGSTQALTKSSDTLSVESMTNTAGNIKNASIIGSTRLRNTVPGNLTTMPTQLPLDTPTSSRYSIEFERGPGANSIRRNDVFLAFYAAMLHVATFPAESQLEYFSSKKPGADVCVNMYETGIGSQCSVLKSTFHTLTVQAVMVRPR